MEAQLPDTLPSLPDYKHKRDSDEFFADSSDPPLFSSDPPIFATSIEDYQRPKLKRQRQGPWFDMDGEAVELRRTKKHRIHPRLRVGNRQRGLRKFDSGVYMGSDESLASESSGLLPSLATTTTPSAKDEVWDGDGIAKEEEDDGRPARSKKEGQRAQFLPPEEYNEEEFLDKTLLAIEDPGDFEGPIFPYWDEQPTQLAQFHRNQKMAYEKVLECVDHGNPILDLSHFALEKLRPSTLQPLRYHIKQPVQHSQTNDSSTAISSSAPPQYEPLSPSLALHLSNASLTAFPPTLHLLTNLTFLSLFNNNLTSIPPGIGHLTNLQTLNVASNQLNYLPYTLLDLIHSGNLQILTCHPNPFLTPNDSRSPLPSNPPEQERSNTVGSRSSLAALTPISYLDVDGRQRNCSTPPPSQTSSYLFPIHQSPTFPFGPDAALHQPPSLLELSLRALLPAPELPQLPFYFSPSQFPHLHSLLKQAFHLRESGGQACTVCGKAFVVPRTEWVEWHDILGRKAVPLLRRGCRWNCAVDTGEREPDLRQVGWKVPFGTVGEGEG